VRELGGKLQCPYLVDPNTKRRMYESADIIEYLYREYGDGRPPPRHLTVRPYAVAGSTLTSVLRPGRGRRARPSRAPEQPLELWSFEASPFARLARETLCELEIPYVLHTLGRRDAREHVPRVLRGPFGVDPPPSTDKRRELVERAGKVQVPYLVDPNTGAEMFESDAIVRYLEATYAA
jgi:glutathione S-transferase